MRLKKKKQKEHKHKNNYSFGRLKNLHCWLKIDPHKGYFLQQNQNVNQGMLLQFTENRGYIWKKMWNQRGSFCNIAQKFSISYSVSFAISVRIVQLQTPNSDAGQFAGETHRIIKLLTFLDFKRTIYSLRAKKKLYILQ